MTFQLANVRYSDVDADADAYRLNTHHFLSELPPPPIPGDVDSDGDVDQEDFGHIQACLAASGVIPDNSACLNARLDGDVDVDFDDVLLFMRCLTGPSIAGNPNCAG